MPLRQHNWYTWGFGALALDTLLATVLGLLGDDMPSLLYNIGLVFLFAIGCFGVWCFFRGKHQDDTHYRAREGLPSTDTAARVQLAESVSEALATYRLAQAAAADDWNGAARMLNDLPAPLTHSNLKFRFQQFKKAGFRRIDQREISKIPRRAINSREELDRAIEGLWNIGRQICPWSLRGGLGFGRTDRPKLNGS